MVPTAPAVPDYGPRVVAGSVQRLPSGAPNGGDGVPPSEVYKAAIDEYRFQAQFNWSRTQYLLAFNAGVLTAATVVASNPGRSAGLVFALGAVAAALSIIAVHVQHDYYRAARDRMARIEDDLQIPAGQRFDTTAHLGHRRRRISVNEVVYLLLIAIVIGNIVGVTLMVNR